MKATLMSTVFLITSTLLMSSCGLYINTDETDKRAEQKYLEKAPPAQPPSLENSQNCMVTNKPQIFLPEKRIKLVREWIRYDYYCKKDKRYLRTERFETLGARDDVHLPKYSSNYSKRGPKFSAVNTKTCDWEKLYNTMALAPKLWIDIAPNSFATANGYSSFHVEHGSNVIQFELSVCKENTSECNPNEREIVETGEITLEIDYKELEKKESKIVYEENCS